MCACPPFGVAVVAVVHLDLAPDPAAAAAGMPMAGRSNPSAVFLRRPGGLGRRELVQGYGEDHLAIDQTIGGEWAYGKQLSMSTPPPRPPGVGGEEKRLRCLTKCAIADGADPAAAADAVAAHAGYARDAHGKPFRVTENPGPGPPNQR